MHIEDDFTRMIFKNINGGKTFYSIGLSTKGKDGNYIKGYMNCRFPKDADIENKTKIKLVDAWIDFYIKDKITYPYVFINKYEIVEESGKEEKENLPKNAKTEYDDLGSDIQLGDNDLPF